MLDADPPFLPDLAPEVAPETASLRMPGLPATQQPAGVTPRRPLRFTFARTAEDLPIPALTLPDLFEGVFDDSAHAATDPRLIRSRARARALLDAHEAALDPAERNLWFDYGIEDIPAAPPAPQTACADDTPAQTAPIPRRIRHLTAADLTARAVTARSAQARAANDAIPDPLRDRLRDLRTALYTADDTETPPPAALRHRLLAVVLNLALLIVALPAGIALTALALLRGPDLRLSSRAIALAGTAVTLWHSLPPLVL